MITSHENQELATNEFLLVPGIVKITNLIAAIYVLNPTKE